MSRTIRTGTRVTIPTGETGRVTFTYEDNNGVRLAHVRLDGADSDIYAVPMDTLTHEVPACEDDEPSTYAEHYAAASAILMDALAEPHGETFSYAYAEALRAVAAAYGGSTGIEARVARHLADSVLLAAIHHGIRIKR